MTLQATLVHIRPRRALISSAVVSMLLAMAPVFFLLYWFTVPAGTWPVVAALQVAVLVACVALGFRQLRVFVAVTDSQLVGNGIFTPTVRVALHDIAQVLLVETYRGHAPETVTQVLVLGADGRRVFRMRGNYWHASDLADLTAVLPVPAERGAEPMPLSAFFRLYPSSAYWFENKPVVRVAAVAAAVVLAIASAAAMMAVLGVPLALR